MSEASVKGGRGTPPSSETERPARRPQVEPTGVERHFREDEIIVSKTDTRGVITYANDVFIRDSGFGEHELVGAPHNLIRHPAMPRCVFKYLWDTIEAGHEVFAYVINMARNGDHYWVLAHVTPTFDGRGKIIGYHSNRRVPDKRAVAAVEPVYAALLATEAEHRSKAEGMAASMQVLVSTLQGRGQSYDEFVWALTNSFMQEGATC